MAQMDGSIFNPPIPYVGHISGGMTTGKAMIVQGQVPQNAGRFSINLTNGGMEQDWIFHFNPRFNENQVIRNSKLGGSWGPEERHGPFPFRRGQPFEVVITAQHDCYKVTVNGQPCTDYRHRVPIERSTNVIIDGEVIIQCIRFQHAAGAYQYGPGQPMSQPSQPSGWPAPMMPPNQFAPPSSQPSGFQYGFDQSVTNSFPSSGFPPSMMPPGQCPPPPSQHSGFPPPMMPSGPCPPPPSQHSGFPPSMMPPGQCPPPSQHSGFPSPMMPPGQCPPPSQHSGFPSPMMPTGPCPPPSSQPSGFPQPTMPHGQFERLPSLSVPYCAPIPGGLRPGTMVTISGSTTQEDRFAVNFAVGRQDNVDDIGFHFNPRFDQTTIVRNSRIRGAWGSEERNVPFFPFMKNAPFELIILVEANVFKVAVNGQHFIEYAHRMQPLGSMQFLLITSGVRLQDVKIY